MVVKEVYRDCIMYEESALAHYIHHLLAEKKLSLEDDISKIDLQQANHQKVRDMIEKNVLGFRKVGIYSLKMNQEEFIFIFAHNREEAIQFFMKTFHQRPLNCHEYSLDFELARGNDVISFRDMRKEFKSFPAIAGCYKRMW
jgi:hypothetical protein